MSKLVELEPDRMRWRRGNAIVVSKMLPFYRSYFGNRGAYVHRIRHATHFRSSLGEYHHTGLTMWCGSIGSVGGSGIWRPKGELFSEPPDNAVHCATCEGRAIGAGRAGTREIAGKPVMFKPRI